MLPILQKEIVEKRKWIETESLVDYYTLSQCTPGVISVNVAAYIGYNRKGKLGGVFSAIGVITPSIIIITIIASVLTNFLHIPAVNHAFVGIRVAVAALVIVTIIDMYKISVIDWLCIVIYVASFAVSIFTAISPVFIVLASALIGLVLGTRMRERKLRNK